MVARLLRLAAVGVVGTSPFPAKYDRCWPSAFCRLLKRSALKVDFICISYYGAHYLSFFPAYLVNVVFELLIMYVGFTDPAAYVVIAGHR
ncbi:MAG: hypothetical protein ABIK43_03800 [candidate division WOR-3 bacterium]